MIQEEKQLLLIDLCARIPYDTLVCLNPGAYGKPEKCLLCGVDGEKVYLNVDSDPFRIASVKPYLRSMSMLNMTEEERKEYDKLIANCLYDAEAYFFENYNRLYDWLLSHHFDYRGLIEKGLALEAPERMYKTE